MYHGKADNCIQYFKEKGFEMPKYNNPGDFFLEILSKIIEFVSWILHDATCS